jgi:hypothetical protein
LRGLDVHEHFYAVSELVEGIDAESEFHAGFRAELVDEELMSGMAFEILEEESGATGLRFVVPTQAKGRLGWGTLIFFIFLQMHLADAVGDLGDFEDRVDFGFDAFEFAGAVEGGDPLAEVVEGQRFLQGRL